MSRKRIPGFGKSGMSRTKAARSVLTSRATFAWKQSARSSLSSGDLAQVPDEQQVLEVAGDRGQVLQRPDRLLAALGIARAQRRGEDLLQQRGLAVGRRAEDAQVAPADAVARELGDRAHDLALGLVEVLRPGAHLALDDAVLLQLLDQRRVGAGLLDHVVERVQRPAAGDRHAAGPARRAPLGRGLGDLAVLLGAAARELLADHA